tara:strand:+ start:261 stop:497 length:237 start_codon:yes stop_codon:yes gene_type:complete
MVSTFNLFYAAFSKAPEASYTGNLHLTPFALMFPVDVISDVEDNPLNVPVPCDMSDDVVVKVVAVKLVKVAVPKLVVP